MVTPAVSLLHCGDDRVLGANGLGMELRMLEAKVFLEL